MVRASVSVQRISTSIMKTLVLISLFLGCVAARGSGPYLPSGWKPVGPAFFLPSEVSKPFKEPVKDVIFSETEASGSDFLREYGPPKDEEVSQDISQQGLPDAVNEQLFIETVLDTNVAKENTNVVTEVTEQKETGDGEVTATEEALPFTETQSVTVTQANVDEDLAQANDETTTLANAIESGDKFGSIMEPTVAAIVPEEQVAIEPSVQSVNYTLGDAVIEAQKLTSQLQQSEQSVRQTEESTITDITRVTSAVEQSNSDVSEQTEPNEISVTKLADINVQTEVSSGESSGTPVQADINFDVISTVEEKVATIEKEVKNVDNIVQNIPELIITLENEVKSQQGETTQEVPAVVQQTFGSLEQAPEGFLEYGPPGFREYGPPKEELKDNTIEEIPETQPIENSEIRRRRFSPKFRSI